MKLIDWALISSLILAGIALSFFLAAMGEPQSLWLWRDVFGLM